MMFPEFNTEEGNFNWATFEEETARVTAEFEAAAVERARVAVCFANYEFACFEAFFNFGVV